MPKLHRKGTKQKTVLIKCFCGNVWALTDECEIRFYPISIYGLEDAFVQCPKCERWINLHLHQLVKHPFHDNPIAIFDLTGDTI